MSKDVAMPVTIEGTLPPQLRLAEIEINVRVHATMNITPVVARRKVNVLMLEKVGNLLHGGSPALFLTDRIYWRVPVILSTPSRGQIGQVGNVDVDAETGEMIVDDKLLEDISEHARRL
ncbi:MAG TPA: hypothetical protein G4N97_01815, partial [Thermoflexia bacterium]|nr:hypothetical protein [Thermoflexia bacterium]